MTAHAAPREVEFFWDVTSPYTYLAATRIEDVAAAAGVRVHWRPFLLGGVFKATGNRPPAEVTAKAGYMLDDLETWARYYGVPFRFPSTFPINSLLPMRAAIAVDEEGHLAPNDYANAVMRAYWTEDRDVSQPEVLTEVLAEAGLDPDPVLDRTSAPEVKERLKALTGEAVQRGAFGAPSFFVGDKLFWGNDRLPLLEAWLKGTLEG